MLDEMLLFKIMNVNALNLLRQNLTLNVPRIQTRFTPIFYWNTAISNIEFNSVTTRIQRQHNEYFRHIELTGQSINVFKNRILKSLPLETWN